jgi:hypothetical protein
MLRILYMCAALSIFALAPGVRADEIRLKDGSKIVGNVVGIEDGAFKVETAYGFAMVRKDSIAEIIPTSPTEAKPTAPKSAPGKPSDDDATPAAASKPVTSATAKPASAAAAPSKAQPAPGKLVETAEPKSQPAPVKPASYVGAKTQPSAAASLQQPTSPQPAPAQTTAKQLAPQSAAVPASPAPAPVSVPAPASASAPVSAAPVATTPALAATPSVPAVAVAAPIAAPAPPLEQLPVREVVRGNLYINQTYGFQMFRAPDWQPIIAARAALPNAIAALGTSDQSTLLIIGRDRARDSLDAQSAATEKAVEEVYENYRPMPQQRITVAGAPAIERQFRGEADKREWSVILVTLERDDAVFTILAMTDASSELVQIQENVIARAIASLQFNAPSDPAAPTTPHS